MSNLRIPRGDDLVFEVEIAEGLDDGDIVSEVRYVIGRVNTGEVAISAVLDADAGGPRITDVSTAEEPYLFLVEVPAAVTVELTPGRPLYDHEFKVKAAGQILQVFSGKANVTDSLIGDDLAG